MWASYYHIFPSISYFPHRDPRFDPRFVRAKWPRLPSPHLVRTPSPLLITTSLTAASKYLYNLTLSTTEPISLESTDTGPLCCKEVGPSPERHRQDCHESSYEAARLRNESLGRPAPAMNMRCVTVWNADHCECFTKRNRLHYRLKSWMPKRMNYCGTCKKFTKRKAGNNGRCELHIPLLKSQC